MSNLIDYLDKVKDLPFDQEPLNILDKVCDVKQNFKNLGQILACFPLR